MTGWLLDTNVVYAVSGPKPAPQVARWIRSQPEHSLLLSILTLAEHRKGIANLPRKNKLRPRLEIALAALEARFYGRILSISDPIALQWGAIIFNPWKDDPAKLPFQ